MGSDFSEATATDAVVDSFAATPDRRLRAVSESLTRHLHAFVREVEPTPGEWEAAIGFLTDRPVHRRPSQEFILLSDVMGVSMLVDVINNRGRPASQPPCWDRSTSSSRRPRPRRRPGREPGDPSLSAGGSRSRRAPVDGALIDVWQTATTGSTMCRPPPRRHLRGLRHRRRGRPSLVPHHLPAPLPDPRRRPGRRVAALDRPTPLAAGAHPLPGAGGHAPSPPTCSSRAAPTSTTTPCSA